MNKQQFLEAANESCRTRTFGDDDYKRFQKAVRSAKRAAKQGKPYFAEDNAGGVANSYKYSATTARWGVWALPNGDIHFVVDRQMINGRSVSRTYYLGERAYLKHFADNNPVIYNNGRQILAEA